MKEGMGGRYFNYQYGLSRNMQQGPIVIVYTDGVWYKEVTVDDVTEIVEEHLETGRVVSRLEI